MAFESRSVKAIGKLCEGKPHAQFDEGALETERWCELYGHEIRNDGNRQVQPCTSPRQCSTLLVVHCRSLKQLEMVKSKLIKRFATCKLTLNTQKTKIAYCKDANRNEEWENISFDFLGYTFQPRLVRDKDKEFFVSFSPAISTKAAKEIRQIVKIKWKIKSKTELEIDEVANLYNPVIRGWINYYGRFHGSTLYSKVFEYLNTTLIRWAMKKYKLLFRRPTRASKWLKQTQIEKPNLFVHWSFKFT